MRASSLYDIIINSNFVKIDSNKISGFRTRLSKYLKDLGLRKKRYNDGFYYYGIIEKIEKQPIYPFNNAMDCKSIKLDEIIRKRDLEYRSFFV
jgi:arginine repressor